MAAVAAMVVALNTGKLRALTILGPQSQYFCSPSPQREKGRGEEMGSESQQQEKQQQLFPSPINILHYQARGERRGVARGTGVGRERGKLPPVWLGLKQ